MVKNMAQQTKKKPINFPRTTGRRSRSAAKRHAAEHRVTCGEGPRGDNLGCMVRVDSDHGNGTVRLHKRDNCAQKAHAHVPARILY
jgi:hypothetical protein